jgi:hypothetical protein
VSVHGLTDAEFDLLADFAAGVLDPDGYERVARLIGTDQRWAAAHDALLGAERAVRSDLAAIAGPIAMPRDVAARLDAALADLGRDRTVVPLARSGQRPRHRDSDGRRYERSRWRRVGLPIVAVAAGAILFGLALGLGAMLNLVPSSTNSGSALSNGANVAPAAPNLPGGPATIQSGRDYQPGTLSQLAQSYALAVPPRAAAQPPAPSPVAGAGNGASSADSAEQPPAKAAPRVSSALDRLTVPDALRGCLAAIAERHPGTPTVVDFAAFQGSAAVIVVVQQTTGAIVVVVGPECGVGGADERYSAIV